MQGTVFVENLIVNTHIGVTPEERAESQRLSVSVFVTLDNSRAVYSDEVQDTLNYSSVKKKVEAIASKSFYCLLETLAGVILKSVWDFPEATQVKIVIQKLDIWPDAVPGFMLEEKRPF
jgi:D-erythro-7,8-dihydroneopterin triphosphate epimerase